MEQEEEKVEEEVEQEEEKEEEEVEQEEEKVKSGGVGRIVGFDPQSPESIC